MSARIVSSWAQASIERDCSAQPPVAMPPGVFAAHPRHPPTPTLRRRLTPLQAATPWRRSAAGLGGRRPVTASAADLAAPSGDSGPAAASRTSLPPWAKLATPWDHEIFSLALPALVSTLLDPLMGMVDTAIVGRLGTEPLAAVGLSIMIYNFSNFAFNVLLYTTTPRIAAAASRDDRAAVSAITSQGLWVAAAIGCTMTTLIWLDGPLMFANMGATPGIMAHAVPYLRGRCIASPAIMMFYVLSGTFRGFKDTMCVSLSLCRGHAFGACC